MTHQDGKSGCRNQRPTRRITRMLLFGLLFGFLGVPQVRATDPTAPLEISDARQSFTIGLMPTGLRVSQISARLVFNRYAGRVIGADEVTVGSHAVSRTLTVKDNRNGTFSVDASPIAKGQAKLPDGTYSQFLVLDHAPATGYQLSVTRRHPIYFQVVKGVASRLDMPAYSLKVEPESAARGRNGETVMHGSGFLAAGSVPPLGENAEDVRTENGNVFAVPGDESIEN